MSTESIPELVKRLYDTVDELERLFPGRHFTPDGHLVGSLGEVWAAHLYGLSLYSASTGCHDGACPAGREVQIKATQTDRIALSSQPKWLIVLKLSRDGTATEEYNGPGGLVWDACGRMGKNGQRQIALNRVRALMKTVPVQDQIPRADS